MNFARAVTGNIKISIGTERKTGDTSQIRIVDECSEVCAGVGIVHFNLVRCERSHVQISIGSEDRFARVGQFSAPEERADDVIARSCFDAINAIVGVDGGTCQQRAGLMPGAVFVRRRNEDVVRQRNGIDVIDRGDGAVSGGGAVTPIDCPRGNGVGPVVGRGELECVIDTRNGSTGSGSQQCRGDIEYGDGGGRCCRFPRIVGHA